jgi:hypothetical protein
MKYTLTCTDGNFKNTVEFEEDFLVSVLEHMQLFLKGSGFYFDGTLDIINEETEELYSETHDYRFDENYAKDYLEDIEQKDMFDSMDVQHSQHYFDSGRNK